MKFFVDTERDTIVIEGKTFNLEAILALARFPIGTKFTIVESGNRDTVAINYEVPEPCPKP